MQGDDGEQQKEDGHHEDDDASRDPRSIETDHMRNKEARHIKYCTHRRSGAQWPSSLVWSCPQKRFELCHSHSNGPGRCGYEGQDQQQADR